VTAAIAARDAESAFRRMQGHLGAYTTLVRKLAVSEAKSVGKGRRRAAAGEKR
jgi:hypothetical protein